MLDLQESLNEVLKINGAMCAAIVDSKNGMIMASAGTGIDIEIAAAANTDVLKAKQKAIQLLEMDDSVDEMLISLKKQYHIIKPLQNVQNVFFYLILDSGANLALARRKVSDVEKKLVDF